MEEELVIRGSLEEASLPELLRTICGNRESAVLTFFSNDHHKSIYINEGQIVFASSDNVDERLGESLLRSGKITLRDMLDATNVVRPGKRLGGILFESRAISAEELVDGVRHQVLDIITSLFQMTSGRYELVLKKVDTQEMILLNMTTEDIIFTGVKSIPAWSRISKGIGSFGSKWAPSPEAAKVLLNLSLSAEESHLYSLCEKSQFTTEEICAMSYFTNFETCRILWGFLMSGLTKILDPSVYSIAAGESVITEEEYAVHDLVEKYNDLYAHIYDFAFKKLGDATPDFSNQAMLTVQDSLPTLTKGLNLDLYGRLDSDIVFKKLAAIPEAERRDVLVGALEGIVKALLREIGNNFGPEEQSRLLQDVQKMRTE
jgi:Domain of unknown function (DUF4388)